MGAKGFFRTKVQEIIGRIANAAIRLVTQVTLDWTKADYAFWDQFRRGKKADYEIGGLFAKPIARTLAAWSIGKGVSVKVEESPDTEAEITQFINDNLRLFIRTVEDSLSLGDSYLVVNPDGTLERISPEQVEFLCEPKGSRNIIGVQITTKLETSEIVDTFYFDKRVRETRIGRDKIVEVFPNLIGMLPVVHWPCEAGANEIYGHPYYEQLLKLFARYDRTINKALDGVDLMGNPMPVIEGAKNPLQVLQQLATSVETYTDKHGKTQQRYNIDFSQLPAVVVGEGAAFKFAGPSQFTGDAGRMLELLFLLMLQSSGVPEWVWGGAVASSKASVDAQMPAFETLIDGIRTLNLYAPLLQTLKVWMATVSLFNPKVKANAEVVLEFPSIAQEDKAQRLAEIQAARDERAITKVTFLKLLNLVDDPEAEVEEANKEAEQEREDEIELAMVDLMKADPQSGGQQPQKKVA